VIETDGVIDTVLDAGIPNDDSMEFPAPVPDDVTVMVGEYAGRYWSDQQFRKFVSQLPRRIGGVVISYEPLGTRGETMAKHFESIDSLYIHRSVSGEWIAKLESKARVSNAAERQEGSKATQ
jgi:hypothetical protein